MSCPSDAALTAFTEGLCHGAERTVIEDHIDECESCRALIAALAWEPTDPERETSRLGRGSALGRYRLERRIGAGGMGIVYAAHDRELDRQVAIKVLRETSFTDEQRHRLRAEAQALARLSHPNVVTVYEVDRRDGHDFVVMELVDGEPLARWQRRRPPWRDCVQAYVQAGRGLAAAHERGLVHRDFKPANCIIDPTGRVRVLDFGLARDLWKPSAPTPSEPEDRPEDLGGDPGRYRTETGQIMGTVPYMPLEQLQGERVDARGDQWSFCASLFEAVYGQRPFALGATVAQRMLTLHEHRPESPPKSDVPRALWRVLVRGLAAKPDDRWPSMTSLLAALGGIATTKRRWPLPLGLAAVGLTVAVGLWPQDLSVRCRSAEERLEGIWDERVRQQVRAGVLDSGAPYATDTWQRLVPSLDDYATRWVAAHRSACADTHEHGHQPPEVLDARMRCLDERRRQLHALAGVLSRANQTVVQRAAEAVGRLPRIDRCMDVERVVQRALVPDDPQTAAEVETLRGRLADAKAAADTGLYEPGLAQAQSVSRAAESLDFPPLLAEAKVLEGRLLSYVGRHDEAVASLQLAFHAADSRELDELRVDAAIGLFHTMSEGQRQLEEAMEWARHAQAHVERLGDDVRRARLANGLAGMHFRRGELQRAHDLFQRAADILRDELGPEHPHVTAALGNLALVQLELGQHELGRASLETVVAIEEITLGPEHPGLASTLTNLSSAHHRLGDHDRAGELLRRVLQIRRRSLGPEHPSLAATLGNLALLHIERGEPTEAQALLRRALAVQERALGPEHVVVARTLDTLADLELGDERVDSAERMSKRALAIKETALGPNHREIAQTLETLASVHAARGDNDGAGDLHRRAVAIMRSAVGARHPDTAAMISNLGVMHASAEQYARAIDAFAEAASIFEETLGPDHPKLAFALSGMGRAHLNRGELALAVGHLERALAIQRAHDGAPGPRALARFALARARFETDDDPAHACALARQARAEYGLVDGDRSEQRAEIDDWLGRCPADGDD